MRRPDLLQPPVSGPSRPASDTGSAAARCARPAPGSAASAAWRRAGRRARGGARSSPRTCPPFPAEPARPARRTLQCLLVGAHRLAETTLRTPDIRQRDRAPEGVGDVPGPPQSRHAFGIPRCPASRSPLAQDASPMSAAAAARPRWSSAGESSSARRACRTVPGPSPRTRAWAARYSSITAGRRRNSSSSTTTISAAGAWVPDGYLSPRPATARRPAAGPQRPRTRRQPATPRQTRR